LIVAVTRAVFVGFNGVNVKLSPWALWQKKSPLYEKVAILLPWENGLVNVTLRPLARLRLKSCELYVRVIEPVAPVQKGRLSGCSMVTVNVYALPTVRDVTGALMLLFQPQPPEPSSPFGTLGGASIQIMEVHDLQASIVGLTALGVAGRGAANAAVPKPAASNETVTIAAGVNEIFISFRTFSYTLIPYQKSIRNIFGDIFDTAAGNRHHPACRPHWRRWRSVKPFCRSRPVTIKPADLPVVQSTRF
jgi:hypothetical protein